MCGAGTYTTGLGHSACAPFPAVDCKGVSNGTAIFGCDGGCDSGKVVGGCNHKCGSKLTYGCDGKCGSKKVKGCDGVCGSRTFLNCAGVCERRDAPPFCGRSTESQSPPPSTPPATEVPGPTRTRPDFAGSLSSEFTRHRDPVPGTDRTYAATIAGNTSAGPVLLQYNATLGGATVLLDGLLDVLAVDCRLPGLDGSGAVLVALSLSPSADLPALMRAFPAGAVVHGGAEWGCLNRSAPFYVVVRECTLVPGQVGGGATFLLDAAAASPFQAFERLAWTMESFPGQTLDELLGTQPTRRVGGSRSESVTFVLTDVTKDLFGVLTLSTMSTVAYKFFWSIDVELFGRTVVSQELWCETAMTAMAGAKLNVPSSYDYSSGRVLLVPEKFVPGSGFDARIAGIGFSLGLTADVSVEFTAKAEGELDVGASVTSTMRSTRGFRYAKGTGYQAINRADPPSVETTRDLTVKPRKASASAHLLPKLDFGLQAGVLGIEGDMQLSTPFDLYLTVEVEVGDPTIAALGRAYVDSAPFSLQPEVCTVEHRYQGWIHGGMDVAVTFEARGLGLSGSVDLVPTTNLFDRLIAIGCFQAEPGTSHTPPETTPAVTLVAGLSATVTPTATPTGMSAAPAHRASP